MTVVQGPWKPHYTTLDKLKAIGALALIVLTILGVVFSLWTLAVILLLN